MQCHFRAFFYVVLFGAFIIHVSSLDVECIYDEFADEKYGCEIEISNYIDHSETLNILGDHVTGKTDADVVILRLTSSSFNITIVPSQLFGKFFNIKELYMSAVGLNTINMENFLGLESLRILDVSLNRVNLIESGSFRDLPNLEIINLSGNRLVTIQEGAFAGAINVKVLNLQGNRLTSVGTSFLDCPLLEELQLNGHRFGSLEAKAFDGLSSLQRLFLDQSSQLISLDPQAFYGLNNLKVLSLTANTNIQNPPVLLFNPLVNLEELYLVQSKFDIIEAETFDSNVEIKAISLSHRMTEFHINTFSKLTKLEYLELRNSERFENVDPELFTENTNMKTLILYNCNITELTSESFDNLINLEYLDLSYNNFKMLDDVFDKITNLKSLKLIRTNLVDTMESGLLKSLSKLETLHLDFNALTTIDSTLLAKNPELLELKLTSNNIISIQSTFLENQLKIQELDLNANECVNKRFTGIIGGDLTEIIPDLAECFRKYAEDNLTSTIVIQTTTSAANFLNTSMNILICLMIVLLYKISE